MIGSFSPVRLPYIVIVGCGRSGTKYTAKLFCDLGIGVGHERLGKEGIASWVLSGEHGKSPWGPKMAELRGIPLKIAHQVRHPLKTISSVMTAKPRSWKFIAQNIACDRDRLLRRSMQYWLYWNELSEEKAGYTYPVEKLDEGISELLRYCERSVENAQIEYALKHVSKKTNGRRHAEVSWADLRAEDRELSQKIENLAQKYGYIS
jgi:hypothetical protein